MTLAEQVQKNLSAGETRVELPGGAGRLAASFEKAESLGGSLRELSLERAGPDGATMREWADKVAANTGGLLERLKVYEIDEPRNHALLRSETPQARETARNYYEVALEGTTSATLRRFRGDTTPGKGREQVPFALTYETIGQVVEGLVG